MVTHARATGSPTARAAIEMSGIRKVFELGRSLKDPVNLSIGQPHFPVPEPIRAAAHAAIDAGHNGYTVTQGIPELRAEDQGLARPPLRPRRPRGMRHQRHQRRPAARPVRDRQPRRRGHPLRPVLRRLPAHGRRSPAACPSSSTPTRTSPSTCDRVAGAITPRTKAILFNARPTRPASCRPADSHARPGPPRRRARRPADQRRDLPRLLLRRAIRQPGGVQRRRRWSSTASARRTA